MTKARDLADGANAFDVVSVTELEYLNGVSSAIQTQIDGKQAVVSGVDSTEIGYLNGVTSAIQTQIDSKIGSASAINPTIVDAKGDLLVGTAADTVARLAVGTNDQVLTADSSTATGLKWATPASGSTFIGVKATMSSLASISNNTTTLLTFDTEDFDTNGFHSTSSNTGRITIPSGQNGYYQVILQLSANFASSGIRRATLYLNGAATAMQTSVNAAGAGQTKFQCVALLNLVATDYLEFYVYQDSGSNLNFDTGNTFSAIKLGA